MSEHSGKDDRPPPPSWLNNDLIQTALQTGENDPSIVVLSCDFSMGNSMGDGYLSNMYRAIAKLQGGKERHLIIKCQPQGGKSEEAANKMSVYEKEIKVFSETLPEMQKILEEIGVYQALAAKCFYHGTDPVPFIVLEDLRRTGFTLASRTQGLDMEHCRLVVRSHALFHASSVALYERNPTHFDYYKQTVYNEEIREIMTPLIESSMKALEETVKKWSGCERFDENISKSRQNIFNRLAQDSKPKDGKLNTLLHGDTWTNNLMFKYNNGAVEDVRLLDFQFSFYSSPTIDLQTFTTTCSQEEVRNNLDSLLKEYHDILVGTMEKLQCRTKAISFEELKRDFDDHSTFGLWAACFLLPFVMSEKAKGMEFFDIGDNEVNFLDEAKESGVYERIMKKLLVKYEKLGVL